MGRGDGCRALCLYSGDPMSSMQKTVMIALAAALLSQSGVGGQGRQGAPAAQAAPGAQNAGQDWMFHGGDPGGTRFSTLTQINTSNVKNLKRAWTFHTGATAGTFEST